jgi:hypothetical protein
MITVCIEWMLPMIAFMNVNQLQRMEQWVDMHSHALTGLFVTSTR